MIRRNFFIRRDQDEFLRQLPGNSSEHIRSAIDCYMKIKEKYLTSTSPSRKGEVFGMRIFKSGKNKPLIEMKRGDKNGT